jgi:hypothetical protein
VLIGALVALGVVLLAASPERDESGDGNGSGGAGGQKVGSGKDGSGGTGSGDGGSNTSAPDDLSFLCDGTFGAGEANLDAEARDRVEEQAREFVLTAYGDPGADAAKYERSVEKLVVDECFWQSLAAGTVNDMEEVARRGGKANAPSGSYDSPSFARTLVFFDVEYAQQVKDYESGVGFTTVDGTAVWVSEESNGDARAWQESLRLVNSPDAGVDWKVLSGQAIPPYVDPEYESYLPAGLR